MATSCNQGDLSSTKYIGKQYLSCIFKAASLITPTASFDLEKEQYIRPLQKDEMLHKCKGLVKVIKVQYAY